MKINRITNINFKESETPQNVSSQNAILMLRDKNASVRFQQNKDIAQKADIFNSNPITALGYKLYRTFSMIRDNEPVETENTKLNTLA